MSGSKRRRQRTGQPPPARASKPAEVEAEAPQAARRSGPFGSALFGGGGSALPPIGRSLGRGLLAVASQPVLVVLTIVLVVASWLVLIALGFEGAPSRLVDVMALPPISTYFDLGTAVSIYGVGPSFLIAVTVSIVVRSLLLALYAGLILEALEDGRVTRYGLIRGMVAIPVALVVNVASFTLIIAGNLVFPILGPGIGFLGFVSALVAGLYFLGFAPTAAIREGKPVQETIRRSARAAMLPGGRHLVLCALYFFLALPVMVGFAPGGGTITANPTFGTWVFVLLVNVGHVAFMAAFAYRWIVAEPAVPNEPVRRRPARTAPPPRSRRR